MKFVNPFDRKAKRDNVPFSVFPAGKITRTDFKIGRAIPIYYIEMMQGNHLKLDISSLTRFMTTEKPLMNDFRIDYRAFFVPYKALDELSGNSLSYMRSGMPFDATKALSARDFFNASTKDENRVHPISVGLTDTVVGRPYVGSLADYLGYYVGAEVDKNLSGLTIGEVPDTLEDGAILSGTFRGPDILTMKSAYNGSTSSNTYYGFRSDIDGIVPSSPHQYVIPFDLYLYARFFLGMSVNDMLKEVTVGNIYTTTPFTCGWIGVENRLNSLDVFEGLPFDWSRFGDGDHTSVDSGLCKALWETYVNGKSQVTVNGIEMQYETYFGKMSKEKIAEEYLGLLNWFMLKIDDRLADVDFKANVTRWLVYQRIYGDHFLNELFIERQKYFDAIAYIYQSKAIDPTKSLLDIVEKYELEHPSDYHLKFFLDYVKFCETMPVRWQNDYFTACLDQTGEEDGPVIQSGDTVPTLFYKRMFAKFKDLINRMGNDYQRNTSAVYGSEVPDATLNRSVCIGNHSQTVTISAIAQTSASEAGGPPVGEFSGFGYTNDNKGNFVDWTATESGAIMVIAYVRPTGIAYTTAIDRDIIKTDYLDYLLPQFGGVGYQCVPTKLLNPRIGTDSKFGLQERYFEYMRKENSCHGAFRTYAQNYSLDRCIDGYIGAIGRDSSPEFLYMTDNDDLQRVFCDTSGSPVLANIGFNGSVTRQLPAVIRTDF